MEPFDIEKVANEACFATQYSVKSKAEQQFYNLCLNLGAEQLQQLMTGYSETVLFVTMEYLYKVLPMSKNQKAFLLALNQSAERWYSTNKNSTLIRANGKPLPLYVENSVGRTIGQCLKQIYLVKEESEHVAQFILERQSLRYRLYLWKLLIQTVSTVDNELSFLVYRSMVYNFQQNVIPLIMDSLLPCFQSVRQQIEIHDLSLMQSNMTVSGHNGDKPQFQITLFNPTEVKFTELVFQVLKQVICFNYNITYSQFESDTPIDNCLVCFPDPVTKKVANKQFLTSIFFVAEKLINDTAKDEGAQNSHFLTTSLECIQKIMLTKLFYTSAATKQEFIKTVLICMSRLLNTSKLTEPIILSLMESNHKFLINIELSQLRDHSDEYNLWMTKLKDMILRVISSSYIYYESQLVTECVELTAKIVEESVAPKFREEMQLFRGFAFQIVTVLLEKIYTQKCLLIGQGDIRNYEDLKKNLTVFLKRIRQLCCVNHEGSFKVLEKSMMAILTGDNVDAIANWYFLLGQFCDQAVFQRNIIYEQPDKRHFGALGKIMLLSLEWIATYRGYNQPKQSIEIGILFFIDRLLSEALSLFTYEDNQVKLKSDIFKAIQQNKPSLNPEQFLTFCYNEVARNLINSDFSRASYTFELLTSLLLKFKWGIKRQYFKQTTIAKNVLLLCRQLSESNFAGEMLTLRKQLFKIITNISFDDILDDYRTNITDLIQNLEKALFENRWKAMYDLTGICQAIDTSVIYRYFMVTLEKSKIPIPFIMNELFTKLDEVGAVDRLELLKSILKLQLSMIENKGQRLGGAKNTFYNYRLISYLMPYWVLIFEQPQSQSEDWDQVILQVYKIFNTLLKNSNTNFFVLERTIPCYPNYLRSLLDNMVKVSAWIESYPSLFAQYQTCLQQISKQLMQVIFCNKDKAVVSSFNQLLGIVMGVNLKSIQSMNQGNKVAEENVQRYFQIIKNVFKYLRNAKKLEHKVKQIENINVLNQGIEAKYQYILGLFKLGISTGKKTPRMLDYICRIIHSMDFLARAAIPLISLKLGLEETSRADLLRIWSETETEGRQFTEQIEDQQFLASIKGWFKKCDSSSMVEPDY